MKAGLATIAVLLFLGIAVAEETNKFLAYYRSSGPLTLVEKSKTSCLTNGISFKQVVDNLGPGWMSPSEGIGYVSWSFNDGRELKVLRPKYPKTGSEVLNTNQFRWLTNSPYKLITNSPSKLKPVYINISKCDLRSLR